VSIGVVDETGTREYYAVSTEFDPERAVPWVRRNVLEKLPPPSSPRWRSRAQIRDEVLDFLTSGPGRVELWAWYAAYDHVALCQLYGSMTDLPRALPRFTRDLRQLWDEAGSPQLPPEPPDQHDALADARYNLARWAVLAPLSGYRPID
jgi:3' exoribonuclease, RNase T-like